MRLLLGPCLVGLMVSCPAVRPPSEPPPAEPPPVVEEPAPETPYWQDSTRSPVALFEAQAATIGGRLVVLGGFHTRDIRATVRASAFDPATGTWTTLASLPEPITHAGQAVDGTTVWLAGGFVGNHPGPATSKVWKYDATANTWSPGPSLPAPRGAGALVRLDRTLHFFGGTTRTLDRYDQDYGDHWTLALDGGTTWQPAVALPNPRNHLAGVAAGGKVYAVGGQHLGNEAGGNQSTVHLWDPARPDEWTAVASLPQGIGHIAASTFERDGRIIVAGGLVNGGRDAASVLEYDPATDAWNQLPPLPAGRQSPAAGGINGSIVVTTGRDAYDAPTVTTWLATP